MLRSKLWSSALVVSMALACGCATMRGNHYPSGRPSPMTKGQAVGALIGAAMLAIPLATADSPNTVNGAVGLMLSVPFGAMGGVLGGAIGGMVEHSNAPVFSRSGATFSRPSYLGLVPAPRAAPRWKGGFNTGNGVVPADHPLLKKKRRKTKTQVEYLRGGRVLEMPK